MKKKALIIGTLLMLTLGGGAWYLVAKAPASKRPVAKEPEQRTGLENPGLHTERVVAAAESVLPHPTPTPPPVVAYVPPTVVQQPGKPAPLRLYTSTLPEPTPTPPKSGTGFMRQLAAWSGANLSTPSIPVRLRLRSSGWLPTTWCGTVILSSPRCSEVHGVAQVDKARERIASEGAFIFVLHDDKNPGLGRELVLKGEVLDRESDAEFRTWGITDGSAGMRGMVITSDRMADIKLFVASFISGIAGGLESTQNTVFGPVASTSGTGVGGLSGTVINPIAQGAQAVLDRYAQLILDGIELHRFKNNSFRTERSRSE